MALVVGLTACVGRSANSGFDDGGAAGDGGDPSTPIGDTLPAVADVTPSADIDAQSDTDPPRGCTGTPPVAIATVAPGAGTTTTVFAFSAAASRDREDPGGALRFAWDFDADGTYDASGVTATSLVSTTGVHTVVLRVTDSAGCAAYGTTYAVVAAGPELITVDGATDVVSGADGVTTLREAIALANSQSGPNVIRFSGPMTIALTTAPPSFTDPSTTLAGEPGVVIDGSAVGGQCLVLSSIDNAVLGIEILGCGTSCIAGTGNRTWLAYNRVHNCGTYGILLQAPGDFSEVGPGNEIYANSSDGVSCTQTGALIHDNRIHDNVRDGIELDPPAGAVTAYGNVIYRNRRGVNVNASVLTTTLWHNTLHDQVEHSIYMESPGGSTGNDFRDNLLSTSPGWGIGPAAASFTALDYNLYFANGLGACAACPPEPHSVSADPGLLDAATDDLRVAATGPCADAGVALGTDANGPAPGTFNRAADDIGAFETP